MILVVAGCWLLWIDFGVWVLVWFGVSSSIRVCVCFCGFWMMRYRLILACLWVDTLLRGFVVCWLFDLGFCLDWLVCSGIVCFVCLVV